MEKHLDEKHWGLQDENDKTKKWSELSDCGKVKRVLWDYVGKLLLLLIFLYLFICSLSFLSSAFRLLGGKAAGEVLAQSQLLTNPVSGLMIGVLVTVLVQSSSTSTSIIITMVAEKIILDGKYAVPMIMGANIGTTVTNTIVSLAQAPKVDDFRRAFGAATVHDMFNWLTVLVMLPVEILTNAIWGVGFLYWLTGKMVDTLPLQTNEDVDIDYLKTLTNPFTKFIIQIDKGLITKIAKGEIPQNATISLLKRGSKVPWSKCLMCQFPSTWHDALIGAIVLVMSLLLLSASLIMIVKMLNALLKGRVRKITLRVINASFPGRLKFLTGYVAILVGAVLTFLVQSSSVFTSAMTPLVGTGVITIYRMFPLTLGSNIGTTTTGILASLAQESDTIKDALHIAFCHLFFNIFGILVWYPIPQVRKIPINLAKALGNKTAKHRWFAILYLALIFFLLPAAIFGLSLLGWLAIAIVGGSALVLCIIIVVLNCMQRTRCGRHVLPTKCHTWDFLPLACHSFKPYDKCCTICKCCAVKEDEDEHEQDRDSEMDEQKKKNGSAFENEAFDKQAFE